MTAFKKKNYSHPVICNHNNDLLKDWYIYFSFKAGGITHKIKRREGVNRIKKLAEKLAAISKLLEEIDFDLRNGWNPVLDPKREIDYNPYLYKKAMSKNDKMEIFTRYFLKER